MTVLVFLAVSQAAARTGTSAYPGMAPLAQYLMPRDTEIALARSAAPKSISDAAEILVFTKSGFEQAVRGTNGFVCMVARSWSADWDDPDFWDPKVHAPICYNAAAAKSQVALTIKRTQVVLAGGSKTQILDAVKAAADSGELPVPEPGSMSYMLAKGTYLSNQDGHWLPHLMFFLGDTELKSWVRGFPSHQSLDSAILRSTRPRLSYRSASGQMGRVRRRTITNSSRSDRAALSCSVTVVARPAAKSSRRSNANPPTSCACL
jgi:hypothetical protein